MARDECSPGNVLIVQVSTRRVKTNSNLCCDHGWDVQLGELPCLAVVRRRHRSASCSVLPTTGVLEALIRFVQGDSDVFPAYLYVSVDVEVMELRTASTYYELGQ